MLLILTSMTDDVDDDDGTACIVECLLKPKKRPFEDLKYIKCALDDKPGADIRQYFPDLLDFLETAEKGKEKVLIHCQMGMSRSSTLVILWLMHKHGMCLREATAFTRAKRQVFMDFFWL